MKLVIKSRSNARTILSLLRIPFGFLGAVGSVIAYKMYLSGNPSGFEEIANRNGMLHALLIISLVSAIPLSMLGIAGLLTSVLNKMGKITIKTGDGDVVLKGLASVPNVDICDKMWRCFETINSNAEIKAYFIEQEKKADDAMRQYNAPDNLRKFVSLAAAGAQVLVWPNKSTQSKFKSIFGDDSSTGTNESINENVVDQAWVENTMDNYEKLPVVLWSLIQPMGGEWILSVGPGHTSPRYLITTRRIFLFGKRIERKLITSVNVSEIVAFEIAI